jgi:adenosylhomocysteine nucleosidase
MRLEDGPSAHEAEVLAGGRAVQVVAVQATSLGLGPMARTYERLRREFAPTLILMVGIAAGVGRGVSVGDVVIADQVIYPRGGAAGLKGRLQVQHTTASARYAMDEYFRRYGDSLQLTPSAAIRVHRGSIGAGAGDRVLGNEASVFQRFGIEPEHEILALDSEAMGMTMALYEDRQTARSVHGWLIVRGISDYGGAAKDNYHRREAAKHAALVMERLLPLLGPVLGRA